MLLPQRPVYDLAVTHPEWTRLCRFCKSEAGVPDNESNAAGISLANADFFDPRMMNALRAAAASNNTLTVCVFRSASE